MRSIRSRTACSLPHIVMAGALCLAGCAGGNPPAELVLSAQGGDAAITLAEGADIQKQWTRPVHPQSNSTFVTINGVPYYRIGAGDELEMVLYLDQEPTPFRLIVGPEGDVRLPAHLLETRMRVAGLSLPRTEEALAGALTSVLRTPQPILKVVTFNSSFVTLMGEISARGTDSGTGEGRYTLSGRTTLLDFILSHSSLTDQSDVTAVMVTDSEGRSGIFDISSTMYSADQNQNPVLDSGDVVMVPSVAVTRRRIYVLGEVNTPSLLPPRQGMTVVDAISEAGGPNQRARQGWVTLVRGRGEQAELYKIPYRDIVRRGNLVWNVSLESGDIIYVSRSTYDNAIEFFRDTWTVVQTAIIVTILLDRMK